MKNGLPEVGDKFIDHERMVQEIATRLDREYYDGGLAYEDLNSRVYDLAEILPMIHAYNESKKPASLENRLNQLRINRLGNIRFEPWRMYSDAKGIILQLTERSPNGGPNEHYLFEGQTIDECLTKAEKEVGNDPLHGGERKV